MSNGYFVNSRPSFCHLNASERHVCSHSNIVVLILLLTIRSGLNVILKFCKVYVSKQNESEELKFIIVNVFFLDLFCLFKLREINVSTRWATKDYTMTQGRLIYAYFTYVSLIYLFIYLFIIRLRLIHFKEMLSVKSISKYSQSF